MGQQTSARVYRFTDDVAWRDGARCAAGDVDPGIFFPRSGHSYIRYEDEMQAKGLCSGCPVRAECLASAMRSETGSGANMRDGIYGGYNPYERAAMHRAALRAAARAAKKEAKSRW